MINCKSSIINKTEIDYACLFTNLKNTNWLDIYSETSSTKAFEIFFDLLQQAIEISTKIIKYKKRYISSVNKWMNNDIYLLIKERDELFKKTKKNKHASSVEKKKYNYLNKYILKQINTAKKDYVNKKITEADGNIRKIWQTISEVTNDFNKKEHFSTLPESIVINNENFSNKQDIVNNFNIYFTTISEQLGIETSDYDIIN